MEDRVCDAHHSPAGVAGLHAERTQSWGLISCA
jgi:hypothetical protein